MSIYCKVEEAIFMDKEKTTNKKFYSASQVAALLGVSRSHIYSLISKGRIPNKRVGKRIIIPASFVNDLLAA